MKRGEEKKKKSTSLKSKYFPLNNAEYATILLLHVKGMFYNFFFSTN